VIPYRLLPRMNFPKERIDLNIYFTASPAFLKKVDSKRQILLSKGVVYVTYEESFDRPSFLLIRRGTVVPTREVESDFIVFSVVASTDITP
jgi:hypothetical protein